MVNHQPTGVLNTAHLKTAGHRLTSLAMPGDNETPGLNLGGFTNAANKKRWKAGDLWHD